MNTDVLTEIPYREHSLDYLELFLDEPFPILFDSGRPASNQGRFDIFSAAPLYTLSLRQGKLTHSLDGDQVFSDREALFSRLNKLLNPRQSTSLSTPQLALPFRGGLAGYLSYDLGHHWKKSPKTEKKDGDIPELLLGYYPWAGILDHKERRAYLSFLSGCPAGQRHSVLEKIQRISTEKKEFFFNLNNELRSNFNVNSYIEKLARIEHYILSGDCYQVNFSQQFSGRYSGHPWKAYRECRKAMAAPFGGYFQWNNGKSAHFDAILCFSPERFLQLHTGNVLTQPVKGTSKRHQDPILDREIALTLRASEKNRAENLMIVDLLRNDLGRCCEYGTVRTEKLFELQTVSNVHHLVSSVSGKLRERQTAFDLLQAAFPGGSITGAPKIRAMEIIDELEPHHRSIYCGSMLYINANGDMDSNISIRTLLCHEGEIRCWGGGGIVSDSDPLQEYEESLVKISPLLNSLKSLKNK